MGRFGSLVVGAVMIWLPVNTVLYVFGDNAMGVVKSASLKDLAETDTRTADAEGAVFPDGYGGEQSAAQQAAQDIQQLKSVGDNVHAPLYRLLQENTTNVSDVTVRPINLPEDSPACGFGNQFGEQFFDMSFVDTSSEGKAKIDLILAATGKSFLKPLAGGITCIFAEYTNVISSNIGQTGLSVGGSGMDLLGPLGRTTRPH